MTQSQHRRISPNSSEADVSLDITCWLQMLIIYVFGLFTLHSLTSRAPRGWSWLFFFFNWTYCEQLEGSWVLWSGSWNQHNSPSVATMTLEISFNLSVLRVLTRRMEIKKCKTFLLHVLERLQSSRRKGLAVGNLQIQLANGCVPPSSAALCKVFIH